MITEFSETFCASDTKEVDIAKLIKFKERVFLYIENFIGEGIDVSLVIKVFND